MIKIKNGLDIQIAGLPEHRIDKKRQVKKIALLGDDYIGLRPTFFVSVGDVVKIGQPLFECKKNKGINFTSPAAGKVLAINRGINRKFESIEIEVDGKEEEVIYNSFLSKEINSYTDTEVEELLLESGLWTSIKARPFFKIPKRHTRPDAIFISGMDTNPLAIDPEIIIQSYFDDFKNGMLLLKKLSKGDLHLTLKSNSEINDLFTNIKNDIKINYFQGPHPAGNVGTHIHFLNPVSLNKTVWHLGVQDVISIGRIFKYGQLWTERFISLAGPGVISPRYIRTRIGASVSELTSGEIIEGNMRTVSGSVLNGHDTNLPYKNFLGRFHQQITVLKNGGDRRFMGWIIPYLDRISILRMFPSHLFFGKKYNLNTGLNGSHRAIVPIGVYEKVMPLNILATQLLTALVTKDIDKAIKLGVLELVEEDLALCTYVCPGKIDYTVLLREMLEQIEKEEE